MIPRRCRLRKLDGWPDIRCVFNSIECASCASTSVLPKMCFTESFIHYFDKKICQAHRCFVRLFTTLQHTEYTRSTVLGGVASPHGFPARRRNGRCPDSAMITLWYTLPHCSFSSQIAKLESFASLGFHASILRVYLLPFRIPGWHFSSTSA